MHYVKYFNINGVDTKQVACIELHGKPNAATEGAVGVLGMDMDSPLHEVYKCVAVNGSIYTWELLSNGLSIISANISGSGLVSAQFPYSNLRIPDRYVIKSGDLIFDSEGYLYQIASLNSTYCVATYSGTQVGTHTDYNIVYPVGSIYMSVVDVSPASFIGGMWEQIKDRFLLSAGDTYAAGATGGEATHILTAKELPAHTHNVTTNQQTSRIYGTTEVPEGTPSDTYVGVHNITHRYGAPTDISEQYRLKAMDFGSGTQERGAAHNNMPPYLAVYMWKRIA